MICHLLLSPLVPARLQAGQPAGGFSLVELLVALTILASALAVVPVAWQRLNETSDYRSTVRDMLSSLRQARSQAAFLGRPVAFTVDLGDRRYGLDDTLDRSVGRPLELRLLTAAALMNGQRGGSILFYPDGSSTGGSIEILRPNGGGVRLRVDWLLGHITQNPLDADILPD